MTTLIRREPVINRQKAVMASRLIVRADTAREAAQALNELADIWPSGHDVWIFMLIAVIGAAGQFLVTEAFRHGEVSLLVPIEYLGLIWATALGYLLWSDVPTLTVFGGAAIVIASSAYIIHRETRMPRREPPETHLLET